MSRAFARFDPAEFFVPIGVGLSAAMLGGLAGIEPKLAVGAALGIAFALITLANLPIGVAAFTLVMFFELSPIAGGSALSFTKLAGAILVISWIASFTTRIHGQNTLWNRHPILSFAIVAFCAWVSLSFLWAEDPTVVPPETLRLLLTAALFLILYEAIRTPQHIRMVLGAFITGATFAALYGVVVTPDASAVRLLGRLGGPQPHRGHRGRPQRPRRNTHCRPDDLGGHGVLARPLVGGSRAVPDCRVPMSRRCLPDRLARGSRGLGGCGPRSHPLGTQASRSRRIRGSGDRNRWDVLLRRPRPSGRP